MPGVSDDMPVPPLGMTIDEFRQRGKEIIDYIADYYQSLESYHHVRPSVEPGYLCERLQAAAPDNAEPWETIIGDFTKHIIPGLTHWQSPHFHAYFPAQTSFPSMLADLLSGATNAIGFSWIGCPAMTELEVIVMDWIASMLGLPDSMKSTSKGGGVIQGSASESVFVATLAARHLSTSEGYSVENLAAYLTEQRHAGGDKALRLAHISHVRIVKDVVELQSAIESDIGKGLKPMFVSATMGYTSTAMYDDLAAIGPICQRHNIYLHVDGAYAGSALVCPEFRYMSAGMEYANSFTFNPHKWMLTNHDCSAYFVTDRRALQSAMSSEMEIYNNKYSSSERAFELRNWQIALSRRFRSLKLWFVIRTFGVSGLQANIRRACRLADRFAEHVESDDRFELFGEKHLGLVCFRVKKRGYQGEEFVSSANMAIIEALNNQGHIFVVHSVVHGQNFIRFVVCSPSTNEEHVDFAWQQISNVTDSVLVQYPFNAARVDNIETIAKTHKKTEDVLLCEENEMEGFDAL